MKHYLKVYAGYVRFHIYHRKNDCQYFYTLNQRGQEGESQPYFSNRAITIPLTKVGNYYITIREIGPDDTVKEIKTQLFRQFPAATADYIGNGAAWNLLCLHSSCTVNQSKSAVEFMDMLHNQYEGKVARWNKKSNYLIIDMTSDSTQGMEFDWFMDIYHEYHSLLETDSLQTYTGSNLDVLRKTLEIVIEWFGQYKKIWFISPAHPPQTPERLAMQWLMEEVYAILESQKGVRIKFVAQGNLTALRYVVDDMLQVFTEDADIPALPPFYKVEADLKNNCLEASILLDKYDPEYSYHFYLYRDGAFVDASGWLTKPEFKWNLSESGIYVVIGFIRKGLAKADRKSFPVEYFRSEIKEEFKAFLQEKLEPAPYDTPLEYHPAKPPFYDFALVAYKEDSLLKQIRKFSVSQRIRKFSESQDVRQYEIGSVGYWQTKLLTNGNLYESPKGQRFFFSGTAKIEKDGVARLVGEEELLSQYEPDMIRGAFGNFAMVEFNESTMVASGDFFGSTQLYIYHKDDLVVLSNRFHLLLLLLRGLSVKLSLNFENIKAKLSSVKLAMLEQSFCRETDVNEIHQVDFYHAVMLENNTWSLVENNLCHCLAPDSVFHLEEYTLLKKQAAQEILDNASNLADNPDVGTIEIDLTGGLDTRLVYAAFTSLPPHLKEKLRLNTIDVQVTGDKFHAASVNALYNIPYRHEGLKLVAYPWIHMNNLIRSHKVGTQHHVAQYSNVMVESEKKKFYVQGQFGECYRNAMTDKMMNTYMDDIEYDMEAYVHSVISRYSMFSITDYEKAFSSFHKLFYEELMRTPVPGGHRKFAVVFMYHHMLHFFQRYMWELGNRRWGVTQSRAALKANQISHNVFHSRKFIYELLYEINPLLLFVPFGNDEYNMELLDIEGQLDIEDPKMWQLSIPMNGDTKPWEKAEEKRRKAIETTLTEERERELNEGMPNNNNILERDAFKVLFQRLCRNSPLIRDAVGLSLYYAFKRLEGNAHAVHILYSKISSTIDVLYTIDPKKN